MYVMMRKKDGRRKEEEQAKEKCGLARKFKTRERERTSSNGYDWMKSGFGTRGLLFDSYSSCSGCVRRLQ